MYLDKQHPKPVYLQLKEILQKQIEQGVYLAHQKLPSERDLCEHYNLSRMTARRALKTLVAEGLAYTRVGKGTFVTDFLFTAPSETRGEKAEPTNGASFAQHLQAVADPLLNFDYVGASQAINEALAESPIEAVAGELVTSTIRHLERQWLNGSVHLLAHNYAITSLRSQLISMMNATPVAPSGPRALLGCTPGDQHEIGLLILALGLLRRGFVVIYFGPTLSAEKFNDLIEMAKPQVICLSAATDEAAANLSALSQRCVAQQLVATKDDAESKQKPMFTFGGVAFSQNPVMVRHVSGQYLGNTIENAVAEVKKLVPMQTV